MNGLPLTIAVATEAGTDAEPNGDSVEFRRDEGLLVVADGMGGRAGASDASQSAVQAFVDEILALAPSERFEDVLLHQVLLRIHERVRKLGLEVPALAGLGTTLTALVLGGNRGKIIHVGDTRLYRCRNGKLRQLTVDHTLVAELVDRRYIDEEQAGRYPLRHVLTNVVGGNDTPRPDVFDISLRPLDRLLVATDGFWKSVGEDLMAQIFNQSPEHADAGALRDMLMTAAADIPRGDDRTLAVVQVGPDRPEGRSDT